MNNRYTFKAKRKDNREWIYGDLLNLYDGRKYIVNNQFGACIDNKGNFINTEAPFTNGIIPETLCQCTGLQDIDGKDIFENDIISSNANLGYGKKQKKVEIISQVIYLILNDKTMSGLDTNQCSMFTARQLNKEQDYTNMDWSVFFNCKIIGNKFDKEED